MKAILVIDINDELFEDYENFYVDYDLRAERINENYNESIRYVEDCKLKPMPQISKKILDEIMEEWGFERELLVYEKGFKDCIKEILRGEEK